jgi:hypothetical protein
MRRALLAVTVAGALLMRAATAGAVIQYDTTALGGQHDNPFGAAPLLDDVHFAAGPVTLSDMNFAYFNTTSTPEDVDALVTFWDNMNTAASGASVVNTTSLGNFRRHIGVIPGNGTGTTGLFSIPISVTVPDTTVGVQINYVLTTTNTLSDVVPRLADMLPTVGTTVDKYWSDDQNPGGSFQGQDAVDPNPGTPAIHENMYLRLDGTVPEPSALVAGVIPAVALVLSRARVRRGRGN